MAIAGKKKLSPQLYIGYRQPVYITFTDGFSAIFFSQQEGGKQIVY